MFKLTSCAAIVAVTIALGACATGYPPLNYGLNSTDSSGASYNSDYHNSDYRASPTSGVPASGVTNTTDKVEGSSAPATGGPTK